MWRRLYLAADSATHKIICADLSLRRTTDAQALPDLINQTHRKIREATADGAYDARYGHDALLRKKSGHLFRHKAGCHIGRTKVP
ncbi:putative tpnB protein [Candidatus Erwinia dacicola]|uniref:TpnB protein n=1 Tax=Candidatus Erwinia dacicola TaxID=252393 RepID=A0A328TGC6_9GAMM|nr:putative tpnB protein [Candidatus Erwinia dacicola]